VVIAATAARSSSESAGMALTLASADLRKFKWMPIRPSGAWLPIASVTAAPWSPPWATYRVYPTRLISSAQARAMRPESQPIDVGTPEKPKPGSDGSTRSNASPAAAPCAVGSVSGPTTSSSSITEPGQPWVMISGSAFSWRDLTWMKWMSSPSISVLN
jgi:hypothetical protein